MTNVTKTKKRILIVEDDKDQLDRYLAMARGAGFETFGAISLAGAQGALARQSFQFMLTDIHLRSGRQDSFEGLSLLQEVKENHPETVPLAMSSDPKIDTYQKVLEAGAAYLFRKPILDPDELLIHLDFAENGRRARALARRGVSGSALSPEIAARAPDGIVLPVALRDKARKAAAKSHLPILIYGETGTGKEEVAKLIHRFRCAVDGAVPFVAVNCANLTGDTAVSALFGHKKGAFTGAEQTTNGFIGEADGGFLFLDEIHTLSLDCQKRLLRVFNDGTYQRLGDTQTLHSDFRIVVASTRDLEDLVEEGSFLLDLGMRLTGIKFQLPPLRERLDELPALIEVALARAGASVDGKTLEALVERCGSYHWQGNVRQLFQVLSALVTEATFDERPIEARNLPEFKTMFPPKGSKPRASSSATLNIPRLDDPASTLDYALVHDTPLASTIDIIEKAILEAAFDRHGSLRAVASALDVPRSTLRSKQVRFFGGELPRKA